MTAKKGRGRQDSTLRNVRAANKRIAALERQLLNLTLWIGGEFGTLHAITKRLEEKLERKGVGNE